MTSDRDDSGAENSNRERASFGKGGGSLLYIILALLALAVAIAIAVWASRSDDQHKAPDPAVSEPGPRKAPKGGAEPATEARLARAFEAAFGKAGEAQVTTGDDTRTYRPSRLLRVGSMFVLLSEGTNVNDCHACSGAVAIHYLREQGDGFAQAGYWPDLIPGTGWGNPPDWTVSEAYNSYPTVYAETGYTAQGCTSGGVWLTELRPDKPVQTELVRTHYDNQSGFGEQNGQRINGTIGNIRRDRSFEVAYSGAQSFTETWVKKGDVYRLETGETKMPQC